MFIGKNKSIIQSANAKLNAFSRVQLTILINKYMFSLLRALPYSNEDFVRNCVSNPITISTQKNLQNLKKCFLILNDIQGVRPIITKKLCLANVLIGHTPCIRINHENLDDPCLLCSPILR